MLDTLTIAESEPAHALGELGVILLLFLIGLEVSGPRLWAMRRLVFGLGAAQMVATAAVVGAIAALFGASGPESFVVGAALAMSSTAIVLALLGERGQLGAQAGRTSLAVLLLQDLAVVPILIFVGLLAGEGGDSAPAALARAAGLAAAVIAAIMVIGRLLARPLLRLVARTQVTEFFAGAVLLLILATALATSATGLSVALGAFLAGLLLAETEYRHDIDASLAPFKGLFLGVFFMSVGMRLDLAGALAEPLAVFGSVVGLIAIKAALIAGLARAFGVRWPAAVESALLLSTGGEFAFVVIAAAADRAVLAGETAGFMTLVAGLSMMATPLLAGFARRLARALDRRLGPAEPPPAGPEGLEGHVVIVGYGRIGRMLGEILSEEGAAFVALDADAALVAEARAGGAAVYFGDARKTEILRRLGVDKAAALAVTMDSSLAAEAVVEAAHRDWPGLAVYARARDAAHARRLLKSGAARVTSEALEAGLDLAEAVLRGVGASEESARAVVDARRRRELASLERASAASTVVE